MCRARIDYTVTGADGRALPIVEQLQPWQVVPMQESFAAALSHIVVSSNRLADRLEPTDGMEVTSGDFGHGTNDVTALRIRFKEPEEEASAGSGSGAGASAADRAVPTPGTSALSRELRLEPVYSRGFSMGTSFMQESLARFLMQHVLVPAGIPAHRLDTPSVFFDLTKRLEPLCISFNPKYAVSEAEYQQLSATGEAKLEMQGVIIQLQFLDKLGLGDWRPAVKARLDAMSAPAEYNTPLAVPGRIQAAPYVAGDRLGALKSGSALGVIRMPMKLLNHVMTSHAQRGVENVGSVIAGAAMRGARVDSPVLVSGSGANGLAYRMPLINELKRVGLPAGAPPRRVLFQTDSSVHGLMGAMLCGIYPSLLTSYILPQGVSISACVAEGYRNAPNITQRINWPLPALETVGAVQDDGEYFRTIYPVVDPGEEVHVGQVYYPKRGGRLVFTVEDNPAAVLNFGLYRLPYVVPDPADPAGGAPVLTGALLAVQDEPLYANQTDAGGVPRSRVISESRQGQPLKFRNSTGDVLRVKVGLRFLHGQRMCLQVEEVTRQPVEGAHAQEGDAGLAGEHYYFIAAPRVWLLELPHNAEAAAGDAAGGAGGAGGPPPGPGSGGAGGGGGGRKGGKGSGSGTGGSGTGTGTGSGGREPPSKKRRR